MDNILIKYDIKELHFTITTDNANSNENISEHVVDVGSSFKQSYHIPYLSHIIQLAVKVLLTNINLYASNNNIISVWNNNYISNIQKAQSFVHTIAKGNI